MCEKGSSIQAAQIPVGRSTRPGKCGRRKARNSVHGGNCKCAGNGQGEPSGANDFDLISAEDLFMAVLSGFSKFAALSVCRAVMLRLVCKPDSLTAGNFMDAREAVKAYVDKSL